MRGKQSRLKYPRRGTHLLDRGRDRAKPILVGDDGRPWAPPEWLVDAEAGADEGQACEDLVRSEYGHEWAGADSADGASSATA